MTIHHTPATWKVAITFLVFVSLMLSASILTQAYFANFINGGFEDGTSGWDLSGTPGPAIVSGPHFHSGSGYAVLGALDNQVDTLSQGVAVPNPVQLSFWYNITSVEETSTKIYDTLEVTIRDLNGNILATVANFSNLDKSGGGTSQYYYQQTFDMTPYAGQSVRLYFYVETDGSLPTTFRIDDVSLITNAVPPDNGFDIGVIDISVSDSPDPFNPSLVGGINIITINNIGTDPCVASLSIENIGRNWGLGSIVSGDSIQIIWDGKDEAGNIVPPGVYNYTATCEQEQSVLYGFDKIASFVIPTANAYLLDTEAGTITVVAGGSPAPFCGNGILETGEECDDGNNINDDGCNSVCIIETQSQECISGDYDSITVLNKKDDQYFNIIDEEAYGKLHYNNSGENFEYCFQGYKLDSIDYCLIYYADPWPGNHPGALITKGYPSNDGNLYLAGSNNLGMNLPNISDANYPAGAKIWLIPCSAYDENSLSVTTWQPSRYDWLFDTSLINYDWTGSNINTPPTLSVEGLGVGFENGLQPNISMVDENRMFKVIYTDIDNDAPDSMWVHMIIDDEINGFPMELDAEATGILGDGSYINGEQYAVNVPFWQIKAYFGNVVDDSQSIQFEFFFMTGGWSAGLTPDEYVGYIVGSRFEPYPYGYSFDNDGVEAGVLTGGIQTIFHILPFPNFERVREPGALWDIFESTYDLTSINEDTKMDLFDELGLNDNNPFGKGSCRGMAASALMWYTHSDYMYKYHSGYATLLDADSGQVWSLSSPENINNKDVWTEGPVADPILRTILSFQLGQRGSARMIARAEADNLNLNNAVSIYQEIQQHPEKNYELRFRVNAGGHAVIPYKAEDGRIYIWENNVPFKNDESEFVTSSDAYNRFITINEEENTWRWVLRSHNWSSDMDGANIQLLDADTLYNNGEKSRPLGVDGDETIYSFAGSEDVMLIDESGRRSGFIQGNFINEIPQVSFDISESYLDGYISENVQKRFIVQDDIALKLEVRGANSEPYVITKFNSNFYTKIKGVPLEIEEYFHSFRVLDSSIEIDTGTVRGLEYDIFVDKINSSAGHNEHVYTEGINLPSVIQQYLMDWPENEDEQDALVNINLDSDGNGTIDTTIEIGSVMADSIAPVSNIVLEGRILDKNIFATEVSFSIKSQDNDGGAGVQKIEYSYDNKEWFEYVGATTISERGNHTIWYRSTDWFGNIEEINSQTFSIVTVTELTYTGNTNGQYSDQTTLKAVLIDKNGGVEEKTIDFNFGSQFISAVTSNEGVAEIEIILNEIPGIYEIETSFQEDEFYLSSSDSDEFEIMKDNTVLSIPNGGIVYSDDNTIQVTLHDYENEFLLNQVDSQKTVYLEYFNGAEWKFITKDALYPTDYIDDTLDLYFQIPDNFDEVAGNYDLRARFSGDAYYNETTSEIGNLEIFKEDTILSNPSTTVTYSDSSTLEITFQDNDGEILLHQGDEPKVVYLEVLDGIEWKILSEDSLNSVDNSDETLAFTFEIQKGNSVDLSAGNYDLRIRFDGDLRYNSIVTNGTLTIVKEAVVMTVEDQEGFFDDTVLLRATVLDNDGEKLYHGSYKASFIVGDHQVGEAIIDESGKVVIDWVVDYVPTGLNETYTILVSFAGNEYYLSNKGQGEFILKSAKQLKENTLEKLRTITTDNKQVQKEIDKAIEDIENSLVSEFWIDLSRLDKLQGHKVFDREKQAVKSLLKIIEEKGKYIDPEIIAEFQDIINDLAKVDIFLAKIAIYDAENIESDDTDLQKKIDNEINKAKEELEKALQELSDDNPDKAIDYLKKAWKSV